MSDIKATKLAAFFDGDGQVLGTAFLDDSSAGPGDRPRARMVPLLPEQIVRDIEVPATFKELPAAELHQAIQQRLVRHGHSPAAESYPVEWLQLPDEALRDKVVQRFGTPIAEASALGYGRNADRVLIAEMAENDPAVAYVAAAWFDLRYRISCHFLDDVLVPLLGKILDGDLIRPQLHDALGAHLNGIVAEQKAKAGALPKLAADSDALKKLIDELKKKGQEAGKGPVRKAIEDALHRPAAEGGGRPPQPSEEDQLTANRDLQWTEDEQPKSEFERDLFHRSNGRYFMKWTAMEWPALLVGTHAAIVNKRPTLTGNIHPLACGKLESTWLPPDHPSFLEMPGGMIQHDGAVYNDGNEVGDKWQSRVWQYLNPITAGQATWVPKEESFSLYTGSLNMPGTLGLDWDALGQRLKAAGKDSVDRLVKMIQAWLKGASVSVPGIGGVSLEPLGGMITGAENCVEGILSEIVDWLISQLQASKFPHLVIGHRTLIVTDPATDAKTVQSFVTYHRREADAGAVDKTLDGLAIQIEGHTLNKAPKTTSWYGPSLIPPQQYRAKKTLGDVALTDSPYRWAPRECGAHTMVPFKWGRGRYAGAFRTEVVEVAVTFRKPVEPPH
jgi:hypothetical protein